MDFKGNQIAENDTIIVSEAIAKCPSLTSLILDFSGSKNKITDMGMKNLSEAIAKCPSLTSLNLDFSWGNNQITDVGRKYFDQLEQKISKFRLNY